jgi:transposase
MDGFSAMYVFFGVTTAFVALLTIGAGLLIYRLWRILKHLERLAEHVTDEGALIRQDVAALRGKMRDGGSKVAHAANFARKFASWVAIAEAAWLVQKKVRRKKTAKSDADTDASV